MILMQFAKNESTCFGSAIMNKCNVFYLTKPPHFKNQPSIYLTTQTPSKSCLVDVRAKFRKHQKWFRLFCVQGFGKSAECKLAFAR